VQLTELRVLSRFVRSTKSAITLRPQLQALKAVKTKVFVIQGASLEANYKGVFSCNLGVDHSALKSRVTVFSSVFSPKTNSILFRLLCKFTKLSARSVEQEL